jgi:1-acyl-sn-glycerol-3-phosphate acyltransferase
MERAAANCSGTTAKGNPCRLRPLPGQDCCGFHAPLDRAHPDVPPASETPDPRRLEQLRRRVMRDVEHLLLTLMRRLQASGFFASVNLGDVVAATRSSLQEILPRLGLDALETARNLLSSDWLDLDTWKGLLYVLKSALEARLDQARETRPLELPTDDFGLDPAYYEAVRPVVSFIYKHWFRVEATGIENVPGDGPAMLVANHSGVLPWDALMLSNAIWEHHPQPRPARLLFLKWFATVPFLAPFLAKTGQVLACPENGRRLLAQRQLVGVFPEGVRGIGKLYKDRYQLARFGRGGAIRLAMEARSPIIPVAIVGAEETYPALFKLDFVAKLLGLPYLPITPTFPLLGALGFLPLPTKWHIHFCKPIRFNDKAPAKVNDYLVVSMLTDRVRGIVQEAINELLRRRRSVF